LVEPNWLSDILFDDVVYVPKNLLQSVVPCSDPVAVNVTVKALSFLGVLVVVVPAVVFTHVHVFSVRGVVLDDEVVVVISVVVADSLSVVVATSVTVSCVTTAGVVGSGFLIRTDTTLTPMSAIAVTIRTLIIIFEVDDSIVLLVLFN
jgi:hypothetical protein